MKLKNIIGLLSCLFFIYACQGEKKQKKELDVNQIVKEQAAKQDPEISEETIYNIIQSIPSPLEIATIIKESGIDFQENLLVETDQSKKFATSYQKAMALGLYGGDLGYINIYEKSYLALDYLGTIRDLADEIKVGHFFNFDKIKRLASNSEKIDSLLYISTNGFVEMDEYLRAQKRGKLSVLLVSGTWLESIHIATQILNQTQIQVLREKVAEQKIILDQLMLILNAYSNDPFFKELIADFQTIKDEYANVTITYNYEEPETKEVDGRLVIISKSSTVVNITSEQVEKIIEKVRKVRTKYLGK